MTSKFRMNSFCLLCKENEVQTDKFLCLHFKFQVEIYICIFNSRSGTEITVSTATKRHIFRYQRRFSTISDWIAMKWAILLPVTQEVPEKSG